MSTILLVSVPQNHWGRIAQRPLYDTKTEGLPLSADILPPIARIAVTLDYEIPAFLYIPILKISAANVLSYLHQSIRYSL